MLALVLFGALVLCSPFLVQKFEDSKILPIDEIPNDTSSSTAALVFGAGIGKNGGPSDALYDRLTIAAELYKAGKVSHIFVSGDNSTKDYNEPDVMRQTLETTFGIPAEAITEDFAGRRTYDTCIRANEVFGVTNAILVTQKFHLPRALYTCNALGIQSVGVSASLQPYLFESYYKAREYAATLAMFVDLYLWSPNYIH